jgi:hypothetical protein
VNGGASTQLGHARRARRIVGVGAMVAVATLGLVRCSSGDDPAVGTGTSTVETSRPPLTRTVLTTTAPPPTTRVTVPPTVRLTVPPTVRLTVPPTIDRCRLPDLGVHPISGRELLGRVGSGLGELGVSNGTDGDAIIKLVTVDSAPHSVLTVYVGASETINITGVPEQPLRLVFATGSHWSEATGGFSCHQAAQAFDDIFDFGTGDWDVTLFAVPGGNAETTSLDQSTFDAL